MGYTNYRTANTWRVYREAKLMKKLLIILFVTFICLSSAKTANNKTYSYQISPECIVNALIIEKTDLLQDEEVAYQINIQLTDDAGAKLKIYKRGLIGNKLELNNGMGESLNIPSHIVAKEIGVRFRLSPYGSKEKAKQALELIMKKGGKCGYGSEVQL